MRILQIVPHYVPAYGYGGPLQVAHNLGRALARMGHEVTVCTTNRMQQGVRLDVPLDEPVDVDGIRVFYGSVPIWERWGFSPALLRTAIREAAHADVLFVHDHYQFGGIAGAIAARMQKRPFVLFPHNSLRGRVIESHRAIAKRAYLLLMQFPATRAAMFLAFNSEEEMAESFLRERGVVIPNGVEPPGPGGRCERGGFRRQHPALKEKLLYGFLGRLDVRQKGLDLLVEGFARIAKHSPVAHLIIVGPSESGGGRTIEELIRRHRLTERVTVTGLLTGQAKDEFLEDIDVFCLMSRFEGLSIALLEAMAVGRPVLVTDTVGLSGEIRAQGAGFVTSFDVDGIERALLAAFDAGWRAVAGEKARALVAESHTWEMSAQKLLRELVARGIDPGTAGMCEAG